MKTIIKNGRLLDSKNNFHMTKDRYTNRRWDNKKN